MSAMDLLLQLDLPTVSDSSDTEDFLQELAAINDSGLLRATMESLECGRLTPLIKEELRCRIQSRRLSEGKEELFVEFPSPTPSQPRPDEVEKRDRRREQNRRAAQKFRKKKKERGAHLVEETERLEGQNTTLRSEIRQLHEERDQLTRIIRSHASVCPLTPRHSPLTVVRESPLLVVPLRESPLITGAGGGAGGCSGDGGCEGLALVRESPLTTGGMTSVSVRESPLPGGSAVRESPATVGAAGTDPQSAAERISAETAAARAFSTGRRGKGSGGAVAGESQRLLRESPLLAALACLSSSANSSSSSQTTAGPPGEFRVTDDDSGGSNAGKYKKVTSKSPIVGMETGTPLLPVQTPVGGDGSESGPGGNTVRSGRRSSLLMQSPVMGGARPSIVMQSPALLVPPTRESPVPLLIINPGAGTPTGSGIGGSVGHVPLTSPLPPSGRAVPTSPVPMTSRPRKSPIALFRSNLSPVQAGGAVDQRLQMEQSPVLFGSPPKQSKHSIPPRLSLSGPKPVKPILPKPPSSSISSASSSASSSSLPCSSPRTPHSFLASPLPSTASPVSATGRLSHASPVFFGDGCFMPSMGKGLTGPNFINSGEQNIQPPRKSPLVQGEDVYKSFDKLRQSPMQKPDTARQITQSPLCILEAMKQIHQSPVRKPDVKRKLNQSPFGAIEVVKQHINQSPVRQMEICRQTSKSPAGGFFNSPGRVETSPMTVCDSSNSSTSSSRIIQQSPVFFASGRVLNQPLSASTSQFLQPQPLPRTVSSNTKTSVNSSLLTLLQHGNPVGIGGNAPTVAPPNAQTAFSNTSNVFVNPNTSGMSERNKPSSVFSSASNKNTMEGCGSGADYANTSVCSSTNPTVDERGTFAAKNSSMHTTNNDNVKNFIEMNVKPSQNVPNNSNEHEVIDVDELDEAYNRDNKNTVYSGSYNNSTFNNFNHNTSSSSNNSTNVNNLTTNKTQEVGVTPAAFTGAQNMFASSHGFSSDGNFTSNIIPGVTNTATNLTRAIENTDASNVSDNSNTFNATKIFPDSPALPSPSIMLDDNALSLEEIERSAAVLEGRDDFIDLLDIQALLELSADHNSNNSSSGNSSNSIGNINNNASSSDSTLNPNSSSLFQESNVSIRETGKGASTVCNANNFMPTGINPGFNFNMDANATPKEDSSFNSDGAVNTFIHNPTTSFASTAQQMMMHQTDVTNTNPNFLMSNQPAPMQTEVDRYAQILASFHSLDNANQNSTTPAISETSLSSAAALQHGERSLNASGEDLGLKTQSKFPTFDASRGFFVSSASSTIHHHPSQTHNSSFATLAQNQNNSFIPNIDPTILPSNIAAGVHTFPVKSQTLNSTYNSINSQSGNQNDNFIAAKPGAMPPIRTDGTQAVSQPQPLSTQEKYNFPGLWQNSLPSSTNIVSCPVQAPNQKGQLVDSKVNAATLPNAPIQAPSGFATYRSRLRELLNAPTTPDVNNALISENASLCSSTNNPSPIITPGATQQSLRESQANMLNSFSGFSLNQRFSSDSTPEQSTVTSLGQSTIWEQPSSSSQVQSQGTERFQKN